MQLVPLFGLKTNAPTHLRTVPAVLKSLIHQQDLPPRKTNREREWEREREREGERENMRGAK
jgi:hypothetical protein